MNPLLSLHPHLLLPPTVDPTMNVALPVQRDCLYCPRRNTVKRREVGMKVRAMVEWEMEVLGEYGCVYIDWIAAPKGQCQSIFSVRVSIAELPSNHS